MGDVFRLEMQKRKNHNHFVVHLEVDFEVVVEEEVVVLVGIQAVEDTIKMNHHGVVLEIIEIVIQEVVTTETHLVEVLLETHPEEEDIIILLVKVIEITDKVETKDMEIPHHQIVTIEEIIDIEMITAQIQEIIFLPGLDWMMNIPTKVISLTVCTHQIVTTTEILYGLEAPLELQDTMMTEITPHSEDLQH